MQTIEALLSLLVFCAILSQAALPPQVAPIDDSILRVQLANDAWRVLYLRGDFEDFGEGKRPQIEGDLGKMGELSGLCFFLNGTTYTNCRGGSEAHEAAVTLRKALICEGGPRNLAFTVAGGYRHTTYQHQ